MKSWNQVHKLFKAEDVKRTKNLLIGTLWFGNTLLVLYRVSSNWKMRSSKLSNTVAEKQVWLYHVDDLVAEEATFLALPFLQTEDHIRSDLWTRMSTG
jgi:hypothetical protein